jgi:hypothetical protein
MAVLSSPKAGWVVIAHAVAGAYPNAWSQASFTDPTPSPDERFGWSVARALRIGTSLDDIAIGAPLANVPGHRNAGEAFTWNR